jgi:ABC-type antimicrobial peptide transport system permease subunit
MNRNLLGFGFLIILVGIGSGFYLLSIIGLVIMIPALLAPSKIPTRPSQSTRSSASTVRPGTRRIIPPPIIRQPEPPTSQPQHQLVVQATADSQISTPTFSQALFPNSIFPSLSLISGSVQPPASSIPVKSSERDEVLELGAILAFLRIAFG